MGGIFTSSDGVTWTSRNSKTSNFLYGVAYGNGTFVAVGDQGTIVNSSDGVTWTATTLGKGYTLIGIVYANNTFVALDWFYTVLTSFDGKTWTAQDLPPPYHYGSSEGIAYGNGMFVVVGDGILTSSDGVKWTERVSGTNNSLYGVGYGNNTFVAVGDKGTIVTSSDGATWVPRTSGTTNQLWEVVYGNGTFVAVGEGTILQSDPLGPPPEPNISVNRASINFGNVNIGSSPAQSVTVSNVGNANLTIGTITLPSPPFSKSADNCSGLTLSPGASCNVTYTFSPTSIGSFFSNSNIPSNDPDENPVTVSLTGTGVSLNVPDITVIPLSLNFGSVNIGSSSAPQSVTIRNDGSANLSVGGIAITGTNASEFNKTADTCSGQVLTPGASCSLQVRFSPTSAGSKAATLSIPSNDPDENPVGVSLSGIGTTQQYTLTITKSGTGTGTATSSPKGISCGTDCTEGYKPGTKLTLKAKADTNSTFTGWSGGGCSGTGSCVLTLDSDTVVTANFAIKTQPLRVKRKIINKGILVTYTIKSKGDNHLVLDLTLQNVARTWFQIRREGNLAVSDRDIPYVILLGPDGSISFNGIPFNRGEWLLLQASKPGSLGGQINPWGDENNLALGALSLDLFGRGLFGVVLPPNIFTSTQLNLLLNFAIAYKDPILEKISIDLGKKLAKKGLPNLIVNLITWLGNLDLSDHSTKEVIDELYQTLSHFVDEWSRKIAEGFETILGVFNLPDHAALV